LAGEVSTLALIPRVVDAVAPRPVVAAGDIADGRAVVAVLALGAQAAMLGTRILASAESRAHPQYKQSLLEADEGGYGPDHSVRTRLAKRPAPRLLLGSERLRFYNYPFALSVTLTDSSTTSRVASP
jgi:NAD(P)H-dependent flavin oxidoreductase YrpB (nitropropane dioxygenase family)